MYVLAPETLHGAWLSISPANHKKWKSQQAAKLYHHIYHTWLCNSARWLQSMADECKQWSECCVLCVVCVMGRSDTGPAEYQDSRDRCSDKCCHNHISSRSRDVVGSCSQEATCRRQPTARLTSMQNYSNIYAYFSAEMCKFWCCMHSIARCWRQWCFLKSLSW